LRSYVSTPCWVETSVAGRIGAAEGISGFEQDARKNLSQK